MRKPVKITPRDEVKKCSACRFNDAEESLGGICWLCHCAKQLKEEVQYQAVQIKKAMCPSCGVAEPMGGFALCWLCSSKFTLINAPKIISAYIEVVSPKGKPLGFLKPIQGSSETDLWAEFGTVCMRAGFTHWHMKDKKYDNGHHFAQMTTKKPSKMTVYVAPKIHA